MMSKEQLMNFFDSNFSEVKEMVFNAAVFSYEPDKETCMALSEGLRILANAGNKNAAVLYCAIATYGDNADCFSTDVAGELLFAAEALDEYHELIKEEFEDVVDEDHFDYMYEFPVIYFFKNVINVYEAGK